MLFNSIAMQNLEDRNASSNLCFEQKYEKYRNFYLKTFSFLVEKFSIILNRRVFVME